VRAHARAGGILARTLDLPGTGRASRSAERVEDGALGAWRTTIVRPTTPPPWPSVLFANGATPDGRAHPGVRRLGVALARSGYLVLIPDLPGIAAGDLFPRSLGAAPDCATRPADST